MAKTLWIAGFLLLLSACSSTPKWTSVATTDTNESFIAVGTGSTPQAALQNSLQNLNNRLIVNIESRTTTNSTKQTNGQVSQSFKQTGVSQSEAFDFISPTALDRYQEKGVHFVKVAVNKDTFFQQITSFLDQKLAPVLTIQGDAEILTTGLRLWPELPKIERYISLLERYRPIGALYRGRVTGFKQDFADIASQTQFEVITSPDQSIASLELDTSLGNSLSDIGFAATADNQLTLLIVGPTIQSYTDAPFTVVKMLGQRVVTFNNKIILKQPINISYVDTEKNTAMQRARDLFVEQALGND